MYCIKCGVKLADTEKKCPLCYTVVCHPEFVAGTAQPHYPGSKLPKRYSGGKALQGATIILYLIPLLVCFLADLSMDGKLAWFGYVAGASLVAYVVFALPMWFSKPNPVIFVPCDFAAAAVYLLYIDLVTGGNWFLPFAFPVIGGLCLITSAVVTLLYYLRRGRLYVIGGALMALGAFMLEVESLLGVTFGQPFIGWSLYPLSILFVLGGLLIYLAIHPGAREMMERKLFF